MFHQHDYTDQVGVPLDITPAKIGADTNSVYPYEEDIEQQFKGGNGLIADTLLRDQTHNFRNLKQSIIKVPDFAEHIIYNDIIRNPLELDVGFIIDDKDYTLELWNTKKHNVTITDVDFSPDASGLDLVYPVPPITIPKRGNGVYSLTVLQQGPPTQKTTISFIIGGVSHNIFVEGIRVVSLPFEPNWGSKVQMDFIFETVLYQTERYNEQRRPLQSLPRRGEHFTIDEKDLTAQRFMNSVIYGKDKIYGVPIFNEIFHPTNATVGDTVINTASNIEKLWNLNNSCSYVMFFDFVSSAYEVKEISVVGTNSITLTDALVKTFTIGNTVLYPIFLCYLDSVRWRGKKDDFDSVDVYFLEV